MVISKKKRSSLPFRLEFLSFFPQNHSELSKKKRFSLPFRLEFLSFFPKIMVISKKKGLHFHFVSNFSLFLPKIMVISKKKKKVFASISSQIFTFFSLHNAFKTTMHVRLACGPQRLCKTK